MRYWDFYEDNYDWDDSGGFVPDYAQTWQRFSELGLSNAEASSLIHSGYAIHYGDVVIDRFYGGPLISSDGSTRFQAEHFLAALKEGKSVLPVVTVGSTADALRQVEQWQAQSRRTLLFRGQTNSYAVDRRYQNPFFQVAPFGEISLLPSLWRRMWSKRPDRYPTYDGLGTFDWSLVIYDQFDLKEIRRRQEALIAKGEWCYSEQDMVDSDDPMLQEFGRVRLDLQVGYDMKQPVQLDTLLQHYGLLSPLLDLTSDLDVAFYFASHRSVRVDGKYQYTFVGNNDRKALLYVFAQNNNEMLVHDHARVMHEMHALRPIKQSCVVCTSGAMSINLAALFLVGVIRLDYDHEGDVKYKTADLFPPKSADAFLSAILRKLPHPEHVAEVS